MRKNISKELALRVEFTSDRTCCVCRTPNKPTQIAHIDDDPSHNSFDNLAVLCLDCHSQAHTKGGFGRNLSHDLIRMYNQNWRQLVSERRSAHPVPGTATGEQWDQNGLEQAVTENGEAPFRRRLSLIGHAKAVQQVAWSPDGQRLASASADGTARVWNADTGESLFSVKHTDEVVCVAWSPDGLTLASAALDKTIRLWDGATGRAQRTIPGQFNTVWNIAWSNDGQRLAAGTDASVRLFDARTGKPQQTVGEAFGAATNVAWSPDGRAMAVTFLSAGVRLLDPDSGHQLRRLVGHGNAITCLAWSPDSETLVAGSDHSVVQLWDVSTGWQTGVLEGMTAEIAGIAFSSDGQFLAALSSVGAVQVWHCATREIVALHAAERETGWARILAFSPRSPRLATPGDRLEDIYVWNLDVAELVRAAEGGKGVHYANAKVALLGNSSVGKSGLALVLSGQPFAATESSHARHVFQLDRRNVTVDAKHQIIRETLLWDMAGQPGYRLVHQLHLNEVAVALVVFDASNETDPFAGVHHWDRALRQAQRLQGDSMPPLKKFLVAARLDRGAVDASPERISELVNNLGFDGYFKTSAKDGRGTSELLCAIQEAINWAGQPTVSSTELFQRIRDFLIGEKRKGRVLSSSDDLFHSFIAGQTEADLPETILAQFTTCIGLAEARGLVRRLHFGNQVLLQPDLLDVYASALIDAARDEPDGTGSIKETVALKGEFTLSQDERLLDGRQEQLLLIAVVENLLRHEIALREPAADGSMLIFPSHLTRERPDLPEPPGKSVVFKFEGAVLNIYATLVVRLANSGLFAKSDIWRNATTYQALAGGDCGFFLRQSGDGNGELTVFFDKDVSAQTRFEFEGYIKSHLVRHSLADSIIIRRISVCEGCGLIVPDQMHQLLSERNMTEFDCPVCRAAVPIYRETESLDQPHPFIARMDRKADAQRNAEVSASIVQGKRVTEDFDTFLAHSSNDKGEIVSVSEALKKRGLNPWLDQEQIAPGRWFQDVIQKAIPEVKSVCVFIGTSGVGRWQELEIRSFVTECVERGIPVIPVLLPGVNRLPPQLAFLRELNWIRFEKDVFEVKAMDQLVWGITGKKPNGSRLLS